MGEGGGGEKKLSQALSLFRFHLSPFPQKRLILRLFLLSFKIIASKIDKHVMLVIYGCSTNALN